MNDKTSPAAPLGHQIRSLREARGWTLAGLARRAGTSAPTLHRYENGWDRFELQTLRRIATALGARLEVRFVPARPATRGPRKPTRKRLLKALSPLFWDQKLKDDDLDRHPGWVLERVLTAGDRDRIAAARAFFGDAAVRRAAERRGVDRRTRNYWRLVLGGDRDASKSPRR